MSEVTFEVGPWKRPGNAARMVAAVEGIAKKAVTDAITYRMAKVTDLTLGSMTIEFADEPGNPVTLESLPIIRPKRVGQNVEIEVRNGTQFLLNRVFGDSVVLDSSALYTIEPDVPTGLRVDSAARGVTASWDVAERATAYDVEMAKDANFTLENQIRTVNSNQFTMSNLTGGDGWWLRVRSSNTAGESDWSGAESVVVGSVGGWLYPPGMPPGGMHVGSYGDRSLLAGWTAVYEAEHYEVQYSLDSEMLSGLETHVVQGNSWLRTNLTIGDTWYYRVKSVNQAGESDYTEIASATVESQRPMPAGEPVKVTGVAHSTSNRAVATLWNPQAVADYFVVERSRNPDFSEVTVIQEVQGSTLAEQNLIAGEKWYYRVKGVNLAGEGEWSDTTSVTVLSDIPEPGSPDQVVGLKLSTSPRQIIAKWSVLDGVDKYEVQRSLDPNFLGGVVLEFSESNETTATDLNPADTWHYRVRGWSGDLEGTWSEVASISVILAVDWTDGEAPENSPPMTVRAGLGQLIGTWSPQPNADPVTYEVHLGMVSGFIPDETTLLGETTVTQWITNVKPDGSKLDVGTTHFMRLIAKDNDGKAPFGQQGSGVPEKIDLGDAGDVHYADIDGDGFVPPTPAAPGVSSGLGYLYAKWNAAGGPDPVTYQVHVGDTNAFIPDANTLSLVTTSLFAFIRKQGPGVDSANLEYGKIYWIKLVAVDVDGVSAPSPGASGFTVKANTADIAVNAITAASGIIADAAIGTAKISDAAITNAKIGDLQVSSGKIGNLAVTNAKIGDLAVTSGKIQDATITTAKIGDAQITTAKIQSLSASKITTDVMYAQLTISGNIRTAASGRRVEMNSGGLFMYDDFGGAIVSLNSASGSAFFRGNIYAVNGTFTGSISSTAIITGGRFEGAQFKSTGSRLGWNSWIEVGNYGNNDPVDEIRFWTNFSVASIRNPQNSPGSLYLSMGDGHIYNFGTRGSGVGFDAGAVPIRSASGFFKQGYEMYSAFNPPPAGSVSHSSQDISWSYLSSAPLYIRGANDTNHRLQWGVSGWDGPDLRGYNHVGLGVATYSTTGWAFKITGSGNAQLAGSMSSYQSKRSIKRDMVALDTGDAAETTLQKMKRLKPIRYRRNDFPEGHPASEAVHLGFVAEDVEEVFPELVSYDERTGEVFGLGYPNFVVPLTAALQELVKRVEYLERGPARPVPSPAQ